MIDPTVKRAVEFYRRRGFRVLPSRSDRKAPALDRYAHFWDEPVPAQVYEEWNSRNIQVLTGANDCQMSLIVVDIDGCTAKRVWQQICEANRYDAITWTVETGGGGRHVWFTGAVDEAGPSRKVWGIWHPWPAPTGSWLKHNEIRILAERRLVVAPPSVHVETGKPYKFAPGLGPKDIANPAPVPNWLRSLRAVGETPQIQPPPQRRHARPPEPGKINRDNVIDSIADKIDAAQKLGLRVADRRRTGWITVHAIDREDNRPSCRLNAESGVYVDHKTNRHLSYLDLIAELGHFTDWREAASHLLSEATPGAVRKHEANIGIA